MGHLKWAESKNPSLTSQCDCVIVDHWNKNYYEAKWRPFLGRASFLGGIPGPPVNHTLLMDLKYPWLSWWWLEKNVKMTNFEQITCMLVLSLPSLVLFYEDSTISIMITMDTSNPWAGCDSQGGLGSPLGKMLFPGMAFTLPHSNFCFSDQLLHNHID